MTDDNRTPAERALDSLKKRNAEPAEDTSRTAQPGRSYPAGHWQGVARSNAASAQRTRS